MKKSTTSSPFVLFAVCFIVSFFVSKQALSQCSTVISTFPYSEGFESAPAWTPGGTNSDWAWGTPAHPTINTAGGGTKSWCVGNLTGSFYNYGEISWLESPCFDFTNLQYPWISFKIFWESEWKYDGMLLQYTLDGGTTWINVGHYGDPVNCLNQNWYNSNNSIQYLGTNANPDDGWCGRLGPTVGNCQGGHGSGGWLTAMHCLDGLAGQPNVRFRFLFGAGTTCNSYDGEAIDDILIENAPPNVASFTYTCTGPNTVSFTNNSTPCPTGYLWYFDDPGSGTSDTTSVTNPTHTFSGPGSYTVALYAHGPCNAPDTTYQVIDILSVNTTATNVTCNGANDGSATAVVSGGTGPYTYSWAPGGQTTSTITGLAPGTYTVSVSDTNSCPVTASVSITQAASMSVTATPSNASCNNTGSAYVSVTGGNAPYFYSWSTTPVQTTDTATGLSAGTYTCTVTDSSGCSQTATATITSSSGPSGVSVSTVNNVTCNGGNNGSLSATVNGGTPPYTYSWMPGGQTTSTATGLAAGSYTVVVADSTGCSVTASGTVSEPTAFDTTTTYTNVSCYGDSNGTASINVSGGTPTYTYTWSPNVGTGNSVSGLFVGTYSLTVTDNNGCQITKNFTISQPNALALSAAGFPVSCYGDCDGQTVVIPSGGTGPYQYTWSPGNGTTASMSNLCTGNYCITVKDNNGCTADTCVTVDQPSQLVITLTSDSAHCNHADGSATVSASGGTPGYHYLWTPGGQTTAVASNLVPGQYCVKVTDANGCSDSSCVNVPDIQGVNLSLTSSTENTCFGACDGTASVTASGGLTPYSYAWSSGTSGTAANNLCAGNYTAIVTDANNCVDSVNVTITQPDSVVVNPNTPDTICIGQSTVLTASGTGGTTGGSYTYTWTPSGPGVSPTTTTTYTVTATDSTGCVSTPKTVTVNVRPPLSLTVSNDTAICAGGSATLHANASGGDGVYAYSWNPGGLTGTPVTVTPASATTYTVVANDNCGTPSVSDSVTVIVNPLPVVNFSADTTAGCFPLCVTFSNNSAPTGVTTVWNFGDGSFSDSLLNAYHCYTNSGMYDVSLSVTDAQGCASTLLNTKMIDVYPKPTADYMVSPQPTSMLDPIIHFKDQSSSDVTNWAWTFGEFPGDTSSVQNPVYVYQDSGKYYSQLIVTNSYGCKDTTGQYVYILPDFSLYVPNAFSPNGDGKNDVFLPKGAGVEPGSYKLYIFNRWGQLIFESSKWGEGWDGKVNGTLVQEDVYVWKITLTDALHKNHKYIGHVSVIR